VTVSEEFSQGIPGNVWLQMKKTYLLFGCLHDIFAERTISVHSALQSGDSAKYFRAKIKYLIDKRGHLFYYE